VVRSAAMVAVVHLAVVAAAAAAAQGVPPWPRLLAAGAVAIAVALAWTRYLARRMGGHTGDLLGAGSQLVEAAALLAVMARA
jgi:adenosylcobinamide-GDP ribazoletransferase